MTLLDRLKNLVDNIEALAQNLGTFITVMNSKHVVVLEDGTSLSDALKEKMQLLEHKIAVFKSSVYSYAPLVESLPLKIKVPDPKPFYEASNAKELENFLWNMEQYFNAGSYSDHKKVKVTRMYLIGDAKIWCRHI